MWLRRRPRFVYPIPPAPRTAVLSSAFRSHGAIRVFNDVRGIREFDPQAIAGTLAEIESLAGVVNLTHAVIVFRDETDPRLTAQEHDWLWRAFQVPVFEQIIARDGTLYAGECDAHDGLHIESAHFDTGGQTVDATPCACGRSTARLVSPVAREVQHAAAGRA
jgi:hypothetical protein